MNEICLPEVRGAAPPTPARPLWSVRRTSTIDTIWPEGRGGTMLQQGHARDLLTGAAVDQTRVLAEDRFTALLSPGRDLVEISCDPVRSGVQALVGARAGGHLRAAIGDALPTEREAGTPLYLLLDDIAGASLVAVWAWSQWTPDWMNRVIKDSDKQAQHRSMEGVCIGFRPGSAALDGARPRPVQHIRPVAGLEPADDPIGWHPLAPQGEVAARRARRLDVSRDGNDGTIIIDAHFQDSATTPKGGRAAVHEYLIHATADPETMTLRSIDADPRILPYDQCPAAILNIGRLVGTPLSDLRQTVLKELARTEGCTHLNDMARSLAEVPQLVAARTASSFA